MNAQEDCKELGINPEDGMQLFTLVTIAIDEMEILKIQLIQALEREAHWNRLYMEAQPAQSEPFGYVFQTTHGEWKFAKKTTWSCWTPVFTTPQPSAKVERLTQLMNIYKDAAEENERDAARYRWLREKRKTDSWFVSNGKWLKYSDPVMLFGEELDTTIDEAMKKGGA